MSTSSLADLLGVSAASLPPIVIGGASAPPPPPTTSASSASATARTSAGAASFPSASSSMVYGGASSSLASLPGYNAADDLSDLLRGDGLAGSAIRDAQLARKPGLAERLGMRRTAKGGGEDGDDEDDDDPDVLRLPPKSMFPDMLVAMPWEKETEQQTEIVDEKVEDIQSDDEEVTEVHEHVELESDIEEENSEGEEEPLLKYKRLEGAGSVPAFLQQHPNPSCLLCHKDILIIGFTDGTIAHIHQQSGGIFKNYNLHPERTNCASVDSSGTFAAFCYEDGKIITTSLDSPGSVNTTSIDIHKPVQFVAISPHYNTAKRQICFAVGNSVILREMKSVLGIPRSSDKILCASPSPILGLKWRGNFVAFSTQDKFTVCDIWGNSIYSHSFPAPCSYCCFSWESDTRLVISYDKTVVSLKLDIKGKHEVTIFTAAVLAHGIAPFGNLFVTMHTVDEENTHPLVSVINSRGDEINADALPITTGDIKPDQVLFDFTLSPEPLYYVVTPREIFIASRRDPDDHIGYLLKVNRFFDALRDIEQNEAQIKRWKLNEVGEMYLAKLVVQRKLKRAASMCPLVLRKDKESWQKWVFRFAELGSLHVIARYLPTEDPVLEHMYYELVLNSLIKNESMFLNMIKKWPPSLYNAPSIIQVLNRELKTNRSKQLLQALAEIYSKMKQHDKALHVFLQAGKGPIFHHIQKYKLFQVVESQIVPLVNLNPERAIKMLVANTDKVDIHQVAKQLDTEETHHHLLKYMHELFVKDSSMYDLGQEMHRLQVELYSKYISSNYPPQELQPRQMSLTSSAPPPSSTGPSPSLTASAPMTPSASLAASATEIAKATALAVTSQPKMYSRDALLAFLRTSNFYPLEACEEVCAKYKMHKEQAFILTRMGSTSQALKIYMTQIRDITAAIEFVKQQNDSKLWDELITHAVLAPPESRYITALLENLGVALVDPITLMKRIPNNKNIEGVRGTMIKIFADHNIETSLREGCNAILIADAVELFQSLLHGLTKGFRMDMEAKCISCAGEVIQTKTTEDFVIFYCGHVAHMRCSVHDKTQVPASNNNNSSNNNNNNNNNNNAEAEAEEDDEDSDDDAAGSDDDMDAARAAAVRNARRMSVVPQRRAVPLLAGMKHIFSCPSCNSLTMQKKRLEERQKQRVLRLQRAKQRAINERQLREQHKQHLIQQQLQQQRLQQQQQQQQQRQRMAMMPSDQQGQLASSSSSADIRNRSRTAHL
ncbi:vacuolar protein sorting-associated protein 41 [Pelomyxa schiedti]|nr:vacuolar protein sorting-associated protein 41 [Pelomyxa schiedti]